jgi:hypothetical protein
VSGVVETTAAVEVVLVATAVRGVVGEGSGTVPVVEGGGAGAHGVAGPVVGEVLFEPTLASEGNTRPIGDMLATLPGILLVAAVTALAFKDGLVMSEPRVNDPIMPAPERVAVVGAGTTADPTIVTPLSPDPSRPLRETAPGTVVPPVAAAPGRPSGAPADVIVPVESRTMETREPGLVRPEPPTAPTTAVKIKPNARSRTVKVT